MLDVLFGNAWPVDPFRPDSSPKFWIFWSLFLAGIVVRIWAAGVINKCKEVTRIGIYRLVRHPLYLGTLLIYLSFFLGLGNIFLGGALVFFNGINCLLSEDTSRRKALAKQIPLSLSTICGIHSTTYSQTVLNLCGISRWWFFYPKELSKSWCKESVRNNPSTIFI